MRVACLNLSSFAVEAHFSVLPEDAPAVVLRDGIVSGMNAGAEQRGIVLGASHLPEESEVARIPWDDRLIADAREMLLERLATLSGVIEISPVCFESPMADGLSVFIRMPSAGITGERFAAKLLALAAPHTHHQVGIADDRFTAWAAAQVNTNTVVPTGGSAAFLAPLPLWLLPLPGSALRLWNRLGQHSIGDFASTVRSRHLVDGLDLHALASGDDHRVLLPQEPTTNFGQATRFPKPVVGGEPLAFVLSPLCDRISHRLRDRDRPAWAMKLTLLCPEREILFSINVPRNAGYPTAGIDLRRLVHRAIRGFQDSLPVIGARIDVITDGPKSATAPIQSSAPGYRRSRRGKAYVRPRPKMEPTVR